MKQVLIFFSFLLFAQCKNIHQKPDVPIIITDNFSIEESRRKIEKAIDFNDTLSYSQIASDLNLKHFYSDLFYYSLQMANRNNYPDAYFNVYIGFAYSTSKSPKETLLLMDNKSKNFAIYHLLKSYELGYKNAIYNIDEIFGKIKDIPASNKYLDILVDEYKK